MESERIAIGIEDGVAHVELARDDRHNAMDQPMFAAIGEVFRSLGADPRVRAILLTGRGKHFTAGIDLHYAASQFVPNADPGRAAEARLRHIQWLQDAFNAVERARAPVIAAVHGGCIGAGVDLVSACDIRLAAADAFFQVAEVDVAITADLGTLQRLAHLVPEGLLRELAYTGRRMEARQAERVGLVNQLLGDRESLVEAGMALARTIAAKSPLAVAGTKQSLNYSRGRPVEDGLRHVALWNAATLASADLDEALRSRLAKNEPEFGPLDE
ncbi:crotonase/enoyl-CoA hydratase family protein [Sphingosinicella rhizophila]|uniref:Crotonase/enoyl-CoA hydratase family protein n=1 Tax=Sphingosinicella rhizophila TaxID=3050082 RepID=A0ABU3Q8Z0_9SPHN|nr:crotonase/enoyl-CoA hydratase family protein [Sphingosinicella sp. GR2756]MDT9599410.1 crotonase/enoyl-CoA hydratase family protein [Sphingosinicella sp. GR2756]